MSVLDLVAKWENALSQAFAMRSVELSNEDLERAGGLPQVRSGILAGDVDTMDATTSCNSCSCAGHYASGGCIR